MKKLRYHLGRVNGIRAERTDCSEARTRDALVAAARELVAEGLTPTVAAAAETASISRTTAYRYFPNQRALLAAAHPETAIESLLPGDPPSDVAARLDLVVGAVTQMLLDTEAQQRTMLRLSLEADPAERAQLPLRQGRVIKWIEEALEPLRPDMSAPDRHRLALAIRSAIGIEALAWLTDVGGLSRGAATELMQWSARALLDAARSGRYTDLRESADRDRRASSHAAQAHPSSKSSRSAEADLTVASAQAESTG